MENTLKNITHSIFSQKKYQILFGIIILLIVIRLILPYVILHYANKKLADMKGYYGHVDDIGLSLYRGAYTINNIYLNKVDSISNEQTDFFKSRTIDLSVEWKSLLHGSIVGELVFDTPELIFTKDKAELGDVKKDTADFRELLDDFMPLKVNRFEINYGSIHYVDKTSSPKIDVFLTQAHILALNLSSVVDKNIELPSTVSAQATIYEGTLDFNMKLNPLADVATFDANVEMKKTNLVLLNDFFKAYGKFDVNKGEFGLYAEMAAKKGKFKGYVKPLIKDLDILGTEDNKDNFFHKVWEGLIGSAGAIFKNQKKDQIATKITIEGDFKDPNIETLDAVLEVLQNAFIQALVPSVDNEINIHSLEKVPTKKDGNLLQRTFSPKKYKKEKKTKKENKKN